MSPSSSKLGPQQAEHGVDRRNRKPEWLDNFLQLTFFEPCADHQVRRNELDKYCINCDLSACQYCLSLGSHKNHKVMKIYRHVYKDVVALSVMEKFLDCSKIQPYKSNKRLVVALNPLPHRGPPPLDKNKTCRICKRRLAESHSYRYCSIACKTTAFSNKANPSDPPFLTVRSKKKGKGQKIAVAAPKKREQRVVRKRKGTPHRAPLF